MSTGAGQDGRTHTDRCTDGVSVCIVGQDGYRHTLTVSVCIVGQDGYRHTLTVSVCIVGQDGYRHTLTAVLMACLSMYIVG